MRCGACENRTKRSVVVSSRDVQSIPREFVFPLRMAGCALLRHVRLPQLIDGGRGVRIVRRHRQQRKKLRQQRIGVPTRNVHDRTGDGLAAPCGGALVVRNAFTVRCVGVLGDFLRYRVGRPAGFAK